MELSRFFKLEEMTRSDTAARENIPNQPTAQETEHLRALCTAVLDPLRAAIGQPIKVNSGYRGPALNARIGGSTKSQHMQGKAADIQVRGMSVLELFKTVIRLNLPFDQLIYEAPSRTSRWVHVSHDPARDRRQIMTAEFGSDGRATRYPVISVQAALEMSEPRTRSAMPIEWTYDEMPDEPQTSLEPEAPEATVVRKPARSKSGAKKKKKRNVTAQAARKKQRSRSAATRSPGKKKTTQRRKPATRRARRRA